MRNGKFKKRKNSSSSSDEEDYKISTESRQYMEDRYKLFVKSNPDLGLDETFMPNLNKYLQVIKLEELMKKKCLHVVVKIY
jgi:hypothetical protein